MNGDERLLSDKKNDDENKNFRGVNFAGANLGGSRFLKEADLRDADLRGCNLSLADLRGCDLRGADLTGVSWGQETPLTGHRSGVEALALSADGRFLYSGSDDKTIRVWHISSGQCLHTMEGHTDNVTSLALSGDGRWLFSGSFDETIRVWDISEHISGSRSDLSEHLSANAPSGSTGCTTGPPTGQCVRTMEGHTSTVRALALSADGTILYSGSSDNTIRVWDLSANAPFGSTGQCVRTMEGHTNWVTSLALSVDGRFLYSGSLDQTIRVWLTKNGQCLRTMEGQTSWVQALALSADGTFLFSGSGETIRVWDISEHISGSRSDLSEHLGENAPSASTGQTLLELQGHTHYVETLALSADGKWLFSGSIDKTIRVWDVGSTFFDSLSANAPSGFTGPEADRKIGQCIRVMEGHTRWVEALALSVDGRFLYSGSLDDTIRVWDLIAIHEAIGPNNRLDLMGVKIDKTTKMSNETERLIKWFGKG